MVPLQRCSWPCHTYTDIQVAVQILHKTKSNAIIIIEVEYTNPLEHPNTINLFHRIDTSLSMVVIMGHVASGPHWGVLDCIHKEETVHIFWKMVLMVNYLHQSKIAHKKH